MMHYKKSIGLAVAIVVVVAAVCFERSRLANRATSSRVSPKRNFVASLVEALNDNDDATAWLNLGLWPDGKASVGEKGQLRMDYPAAAEALAMKVAAAAQLPRKGAVVVDVGCGLGESLRLWRRKFDVSASSIGVNRDASEVAAAYARGVLNIIQGDATQLPMANSTADVVLAVDSAYHFHTRAAFLHDASRVLKPGGRFAAADIVAASDEIVEGSLVSHTWQRQLVCKLVGIPLANMYTSSGYRALLKEAGLSDSITIDDVTSSVIGGFSSGVWTDNALIRAVAWLLGAMMHHANLRFVIVAASKPG